MGKAGQFLSSVKNKKTGSKDKKRVTLYSKGLKTTKGGMDRQRASGESKPVGIEQPTGPSWGDRFGLFAGLGINEDGTPV